MKNDNKKTQIISLAVLVLLVLGLGIFRIIGSNTQAASGAKPGVAAKSTAKKPSDTGSVVVLNTSAESPVEENPSDPFIPKVIPAEDKPIMEMRSQPSLPIKMQQMPAFNTTPLINQNVKPLPINMPNIQKADPGSELKVCGVIEGDQNVAIIRAGANARYIVRVGQVVDGRYTVKSISKAGVLLKYTNGSCLLPISRASSTDGSK